MTDNLGIDYCSTCGRSVDLTVAEGHVMAGWECVCGKWNVWPQVSTRPHPEPTDLVLAFDEDARRWIAHERDTEGDK